MNEYIEITPQQNKLHLGLRELWKYRDLVALLTKKAFTVSYKQTILGPAWLLITPLLSGGIYTIVFGQIAGIGTDGVPQLLFFLLNSSLWQFFSSCVGGNSNLFRGNAYLFGKVYFPRIAVPVSNIMVSGGIFGVQALMIVLILGYYALRGVVHPVWWGWLLLPLLLFLLALMGMSVGLIISSMTTKYRDLNVLVGIGLRLWMYISPVVYPLSVMKQGRLRTLVLFNPVTAPLECIRQIAFGTGAVEPLFLVYSTVFTGICTLLGLFIFNRTERTFMDTV